MKFSSPVYSQASGSQDGTTFSHNRYGRYTRRRATPVNPSTARQVVVRAAFSTLAAAWPTLSASARAAWDTYAINVPRTDALGNSITLTGNAQYIAGNSGRLQFLGPTNRVDIAPTNYATIALGTPSSLAISSATVAAISFNNGDGWTTNTNNACVVFASRPKGPGVLFYKGPFQQCGLIRGTPSANITLPFSVATGNKVFFAFRVLGVDGRISDEVRTSSTF